MTMQQTQYNTAYYFNIKVYGPGRELVECLSYSGLRWELRLKWDWYFKYRAALLQVTYPRHTVEIFQGSEPATGKTLEQLENNKIVALKGKITRANNILSACEKDFYTWQKSYTEIFPIQNHPAYVAYSLNIAMAKNKVKDLEEKLNNVSLFK